MQSTLKYGAFGSAGIGIMITMLLFSLAAYNIGTIQTRSTLAEVNASPQEAAVSVAAPIGGGILAFFFSGAATFIGSFIKGGEAAKKMERLQSLLVLWQMLSEGGVGAELKAVVDSFKKQGIPSAANLTVQWRDGTKQQVDYGVVTPTIQRTLSMP